MSCFIAVTAAFTIMFQAPGPAFVNLDHLVSVRGADKVGAGAYLTTRDGNGFFVKETPEEVLRKPCITRN